MIKSIGAEVTTPAASVLRSAILSRPFQNTILRESLGDLSRTDARLIKNAIAQGYYAGANNAEIIPTIRGTKANNFRDGLLHLSKNRTSRLVRTAITHTSARSKEVFYEENSDIIKRYQWKSTLDGRTSDICLDLSDKIFKVGNGPLPPAHFNCRSDTIPVI